jgi:hypothetical protein
MEANKNLRNKYYAALVLIAFAMNALLPSFSVFKSASEHIASSNMVFICAADGMKWVALTDLQSGKEKPEIQHSLKLPAIASATQTLKDFSHLQVEELQFAFYENKFFSCIKSEQNFQSPTLIDGLNSRAPPVLS